MHRAHRRSESLGLPPEVTQHLEGVISRHRCESMYRPTILFVSHIFVWTGRPIHQSNVLTDQNLDLTRLRNFVTITGQGPCGQHNTRAPPRLQYGTVAGAITESVHSRLEFALVRHMLSSTKTSCRRKHYKLILIWI